MTNENEEPKKTKDKESGDLLAMVQEENSTVKEETQEKKVNKEENPDVEDPRLYSPLQEPDSPPVEERTCEKSPAEEEEASPEDKQ
jgi:hypothetical protein